MTKEKTAKGLQWLGICLILGVMLLNPLTIEQLFFTDTYIGSTYTIVLILIIDCIVLLLGLLFYFKPLFIFENKKEILLLGATFVFCFLVLEVGARLYLCYGASYTQQSKYLLYGQCDVPSLYSPHPYLTYYGTPYYESPDGLNVHNSYGFRGPEVPILKPEDVYRIVTIGGSTTYSVQVADWRNDFARQLEKELQEKYPNTTIEVVNAGLSGWNSWESLIDLEFRILDLEPDMVIIRDNINDLHSRLVNPAEYKGDNMGRRRSWEEKPLPLSSVIFYSTFVRLATGINPQGLGQFVGAPTTQEAITETGFIERLNGTVAETLEENKPIYFERNLRNMIAVAGEHNVSVLLATWAYTIEIEGDYINAPFYGPAIAEQNDVIKNVGASHGILVYDLAAEMPTNATFWADGRHANEAGVAIEGALFATYIYENEMVEESETK